METGQPPSSVCPSAAGRQQPNADVWTEMGGKCLKLDAEQAKHEDSEPVVGTVLFLRKG